MKSLGLIKHSNLQFKHSLNIFQLSYIHEIKSPVFKETVKRSHGETLYVLKPK
jgi:hypothetical protein